MSELSQGPARLGDPQALPSWTSAWLGRAKLTSSLAQLDLLPSLEVNNLWTAWIHTSVSRFLSSPVCLSVFLIGFFSTIVALIDLGTTMNFINERIVATLGFETEPCAPTRVVLADGRTLAHSNHQVTLKFSITGVIQMQIFLVVPIGIYLIIFGMP